MLQKACAAVFYPPHVGPQNIAADVLSLFNDTRNFHTPMEFLNGSSSLWARLYLGSRDTDAD